MKAIKALEEQTYSYTHIFNPYSAWRYASQNLSHYRPGQALGDPGD